MNETHPPSETRPTARLNHKQCSRMRNRPVARLLAGSRWVLKTWLMDLEHPVPALSWVEQRLADSLADTFGKPMDLDALHVNFSTEQDPAVDQAGNEDFELRLSLRQLSHRTLNHEALAALHKCVDPDAYVTGASPPLSVRQLFESLTHANWAWEYDLNVRQFWRRHSGTWQMLAKLSFLDNIYRLYKRGDLSRDGYALGLDVLGLGAFPKNARELETNTSPLRSTVCGVMFGDEPVPGILHLKSRVTGHCFIHVMSKQPYCLEYISDQALYKPEKLLEALNTSAWHRLHLGLDLPAGPVTLSTKSDNVFAWLCDAQRLFCVERPESEGFVEAMTQASTAQQDYLFFPIESALAMISAQNYWHADANVKAAVPTPLDVANAIMGTWLKQTFNLRQKPEHVYIRYLPGSSKRPWGTVRIPANHVLIVPDEKPIALGHALLQNFRALLPSGYDDEGGRWVVYTDPSGAGDWSEERSLPVSAADIEQKVRSIEFLDVMTHRLQRFWQHKGSAIERDLSTTLITQALYSLKNGHLSASALKRLSLALDEDLISDTERQTSWSSIGFQISSGHLGAEHSPVCSGLLLLSHTHEPGWLLYQPGQHPGLVEISDRAQLISHLRRSARDEDWRKMLLNHMPVRFHARLSFILELWGDVRRPPPPISMLRPWTDQIYNEAVHKAQAYEYFEHKIPGSAVAFLQQCLRENSLKDAQDSIVTTRELAINYWAQLVNRLHLLLAPMALLLPPAALASLATAAGSIGLNALAANLPGYREVERRQLMMAVLTLGLLQRLPATSALLRGLNRFITPLRAVRTLQTNPPLRNFATWLQHITHPRRTTLAPFFNGAGPMKHWQVAANTAFGINPVKVWKLGSKFLLWTSHRAQARTLVVSSHGYYLPWTRATKIPNGTELSVYAPEGHELIDPGLHKVVSQSIKPYAYLDNNLAIPGPAAQPFASLIEGNRLMSGTQLPGSIKNYKLMKFQSDTYESYKDISEVVINSQHSPWPNVPAVPMDVLTVRNRFGVTSPSLEDLFDQLERTGIHYDRILLVHCRCSAINALLKRAPRFNAPHGTVVIPP